MQKPDTLLRKFWNQEITREELWELHQLLEKREGHGHIDLPDKPGEELDPVKADQILQALHERMANISIAPVPVKKMYGQQWWWAAAAVLIVLVTGYFISNQQQARQQVTASATVRMKVATQKQYFNNTDSISNIVLSDHSIVKLYPGSAISFIQDFGQRQRNITLTGKAFFKVAKDKSRPFTVLANKFTTTALGTEFTVDANNINKISVKLFEGKVVIRATGKRKESWTDQYLLPNQEFAYNAQANKFSITVFMNAGKEVSNLTSNMPVKEMVPLKISLDFNNRPLQYVFNKLELAYDIRLVYCEKDIKGKYFTGIFSQQDEIKNILSLICNINGLDFTDNGEQKITIHNAK